MIVGFLTLAGVAIGTLISRAIAERREHRLLAYLMRGQKIAVMTPPTVSEVKFATGGLIVGHREPVIMRDCVFTSKDREYLARASAIFRAKLDGLA